MTVVELLSLIIQWAEANSDIVAVLLVGSHARNEATPRSDIDLEILANNPEAFLEDSGWLLQFGDIKKKTVEEWGKR